MWDESGKIEFTSSEENDFLPVEEKEPEENRILFLDIDGVLNSKSTFVVLGPSRHFDEQSHFNPVSIKLIHKVCKECNLYVYIHSTWANHVDDSYFKREFLRYGCDFNILPHYKPDKKSEEDRRQRIEQAISYYKPDAYVIVDDYEISGLGPDRGRLVLVDYANGFGWHHYEKILSFFGKKPPVVLI